MVILSEDKDLQNEKWKNSFKTWMRCIELAMLISLISSFCLFSRIKNHQVELENVTSQLNELQKLARASTSSMGRMEENIFSIKSSNKVVRQKINQFENDFVEIKKRNNMNDHTGPRAGYKKKFENGAFQVTPSELTTASKEIFDNVTMFYEEGLNDEPFSRNLEEESYNPCGALNFFQVVIDMDRDYNETSWKLVKMTDDLVDEVIIEKKIPKPPSPPSRRPTIPYEFTQCIEAGIYIFTIYDSFGDGIRCGRRGVNAPSCYRIHINNENIDGALFSSEYSHRFTVFPIDKSVCLGHKFEVNVNLDERFNGGSWILLRMRNTPLAGGAIAASNGTLVYSTCLIPGYYHFGVVDSDGEEIICEAEDGKCLEIRIDGELVENVQSRPNMRQTFFVSIEGVARSPKCLIRPILAPINEFNLEEYDERIERIMSIITSLSPMAFLTQKDSPQYRAACFIIFDDERKLDAENSNIVERYVMSVLLFATGRYSFVELPSDTCDYRDVECDERGYITRLNWWRQDISGFVPDEISQLRFLEYMHLDSNNLEGTIPTQLGSMQYLKELRISGNKLHGPIPTELGSLSWLEDLRLGSNFLDTTIPSDIGSCTSLKFIGLAFADLVGTIPPELFNAKSLEWVYLSDNYLTGTIPKSIGRLEKVIMIMLRNNRLQGTIPEEIGQLSNMWHLFLDLNQLTGTIPSQMNNCKSLHEVVIRDNNLNGSLPDIFGTLKNLHSFDVSNNGGLSGLIPDSLWSASFNHRGKRNKMTKNTAPGNALFNINGPSVLKIDGTDLIGTVPESFCNLVQEFRSDHTGWFRDAPKVDCTCCTDFSQCHFWMIGQSQSNVCPKQSILEIPSNQAFGGSIVLNDFVSKEKLNVPNLIGIAQHFCISPTGCYGFQDSEGKNLFYGYSSESNSLINRNVCDPVIICGNEIHATHPKREGLNHLMQIAVPSVDVLKDPNSANYRALCWMMNEVNEEMPKDLMFHNYKVCDGTLAQRYALAVILFSQEVLFGFPSQTDLFNFLGTQDSCEWGGIECEANKNYVSIINNAGSRFISFRSEFTLLHRLTYLDLSRNFLQGTFHPGTFDSWPYLTHLDLSHNSLEGEIPEQLVQLPQIETILLNENNFDGTLPTGIKYSPTIKKIDVGNNLLRGKIPNDLLVCPGFEYLDLSKNNFDGGLPAIFDNTYKLKVIKLNENMITGSIPTELFAPPGLETIMIQTNQLTGSIPIGLGLLKNLKTIAMNHNKLKGSIPADLSQLAQIDSLLLHHNQLTGIAPIVNLTNRNKTSYITDCGQPHFELSNSLDCEICTMCCNSENKCQAVRRWPISIVRGGVLVAIVAPILVVLVAFILFQLSKITGGPLTNASNESIAYAGDSVYHFIHSSDIRAIFLFISTAALQTALFVFYLAPSDLQNEDTDFQFSYRCPGNSLDCILVDAVDFEGWIMFGFVTLIYLGSDLVMSIMHIRKAVFIRDWNLLVGGVVVLALTTLALYTSTVYNIALADSNTDLIMNAVILLFINDLDEKVRSIMVHLCPGWSEKITNEVNEKMSEQVNQFIARQHAMRELVASF